MKVGLVAWSFDTAQGVSRCVVELAGRLASSCDVHVFVASADHPVPAGVTIHRMPLRMGRHYPAELEYLARAGDAIRKERCDLVHLHIPVRFPADIFTCHSVAPSIVRCRDMSLRQRLPYLFQIPLTGYHFRNRKTLIAAVSERVRQDAARHYGRDPERILVIPNGVDLARFRSDAARARRRELRALLGIGESRFVFILVGNNLRLKGAHFAAGAVARLPEEAVLLIVGAGRPGDVPDPEGHLGRLMRSGRAVFARPDGEIAGYYGAADALLFPSQYESFGLVVLEAMASGIPVITSRAVAFGDEAIRDGENGFVVESPSDVDGLVERARLLLERPGIARTVAESGRKCAESYSWERHVTLTKSAYERVMEERGGRPPGTYAASESAGRRTGS